MSGMPSFAGHSKMGEIEPGMYHVTVEEAEHKETKENKLSMIAVRFSVDGQIQMFSDFFVLKTKAGEDNEIAYGKLIELSEALGLGDEGGYGLSDLLGKQCRSRLYMDGDFIKSGKYYHSDTETAECLNAAVDDLPF